MDFQEAFLILFWPVWERMLGLFLAASIAVAIWHIVVSGLRKPFVRQFRFGGRSGQEGGDE
jgi:hypothetical protein